jgi:hypothetical protein
MCTGNLYPAGMANLYPASHCSTSFESMPLPLCPSVPSPKTNALFLSQLSGPGCSKKKLSGPGAVHIPPPRQRGNPVLRTSGGHVKRPRKAPNPGEARGSFRVSCGEIGQRGARPAATTHRKQMQKRPACEGFRGDRRKKQAVSATPC